MRQGTDIGFVLQNQTQHFQTNAQMISDHMGWSLILDELLCRADLSQATMHTQTEFLDDKIKQLQSILRDATESARSSADVE